MIITNGGKTQQADASQINYRYNLTNLKIYEILKRTGQT